MRYLSVCSGIEAATVLGIGSGVFSIKDNGGRPCSFWPLFGWR
jgi:hypothetical protein